MYTAALSPRNIKSKYQYSFKNSIFFSLINFSFSKISSSIKYGLISIGWNLLIGWVSVMILPLIMRFLTTVLNYTCFKICSFFVWLIHQNNVTFITSKILSFLHLKCFRSCNKYSLFQRFPKSTKIIYILWNFLKSSKGVWSSSPRLIDIVLSLRPCIKWLSVKTSTPGISYVKVNGRLLKFNFISHETVMSSSKVILAPNSIFSKNLLIDLTILSNISHHQGERGGLKCHFKP